MKKMNRDEFFDKYINIFRDMSNYYNIHSEYTNAMERIFDMFYETTNRYEKNDEVYKERTSLDYDTDELDELKDNILSVKKLEKSCKWLLEHFDEKNEVFFKDFYKVFSINVNGNGKDENYSNLELYKKYFTEPKEVVLKMPYYSLGGESNDFTSGKTHIKIILACEKTLNVDEKKDYTPTEIVKFLNSSTFKIIDIDWNESLGGLNYEKYLPESIVKKYIINEEKNYDIIHELFEKETTDRASKIEDLFQDRNDFFCTDKRPLSEKIKEIEPELNFLRKNIDKKYIELVLNVCQNFKEEFNPLTKKYIKNYILSRKKELKDEKKQFEKNTNTFKDELKE